MSQKRRREHLKTDEKLFIFVVIFPIAQGNEICLWSQVSQSNESNLR